MGKRPKPGGRYEDGAEGARSGRRSLPSGPGPRGPRTQGEGAGAGVQRRGSGDVEQVAGEPSAAADPPPAGGRKRRLDLNLPQVAGSAVAAVLAAKFASNLGVYGTILGAGVVSAVATCSGSLFQQFFHRTGEQIREVTVQRRPRVRQAPALATSGGRPVPETFRPMRPDAGVESSGAWASRSTAWGVATTTWGVRDSGMEPHAAGDSATRPLHAGGALAGERRPDDTATRLLRRYQAGRHETRAPHRDDQAGNLDDDHAYGADVTRLLGREREEGDAGHAAAGLDTATRLLRRPHPVPGDPPERGHTTLLRKPGEPNEHGEPGTPSVLGMPADPGPGHSNGDLPPDTFTEGTVHRARARGLKRPLLAACLVFAVAMGGITTYEWASGHSLNGDRMRTTIGDVLSGGDSGSGHAPTTPAAPSGQPSQGSGGARHHKPSGGDTRVSQAPDQQSSPSPTPSGTRGSGTAPTPGTGATSGNDKSTDSDGATGGHGQTSTPTPTPTATQGGGPGTGGSATRQPGDSTGD